MSFVQRNNENVDVTNVDYKSGAIKRYEQCAALFVELTCGIASFVTMRTVELVQPKYKF